MWKNWRKWPAVCLGLTLLVAAFAPPDDAIASPQVPEEEDAPAASRVMFDPDEFARKYESYEVVATGYYAGKESTGKEPGHPLYGITYSGVQVRRDQHSLSTIAADINVFPLGTVLYVPGYGYGIVADTGSAVKGHHIDLYFQTKEAVYREWGKKKLRVYVIEWGNGKFTKEMMEQKSLVYKQ